ncbi:mechanosensitive ion channel domain-containing protein [Thiomicrorhabdus sp.]|uniref:mechanosensitive ion channel domain-containing protein n=1 Tax=Thiomicrorhabdus sp. TaxID=2039724 RepID=UPI0029C701DA|nr:mechanosensitive ion channel domain-containing protein [Thiomicrorhabdus sp.]
MQLPYWQIIFSSLVVLAYWGLSWSVKLLLTRLGESKSVPAVRIDHILKYLKVIGVFVVLILLMMIWGVDYRGLLVLASSVVAVLGVALFAQWSILSNITAGVIVFFSFPARIGDEVEIIDGANSLRGTIVEINIFQVVLQDADEHLIAYPNSLILQRPVIKHDKPTAEQESKPLPKMAQRIQQSRRQS